MALVARMTASEVTNRWTTGWEEGTADDPDAKTPAEAFANYTYGVPFWLREFEYIRPATAVQEHFKLGAVRSGGEDDPNNEFFTASPSGSFEMMIENPAAQGYIKAGETYRVTVEKIRGPRDAPSD